MPPCAFDRDGYIAIQCVKFPSLQNWKIGENVGEIFTFERLKVVSDHGKFCACSMK